MTNIVDLFIEGDEKEVIEKTLENEMKEVENRKYDIILKALEIVDKYDFDPWNIDLSKFVDLFIKEVNENFREFPVAGKIIYMAWLNLKNKSERLIPKEETGEEGNFLLDDGLSNFYPEQESNEGTDIMLSYIPTDKRNISIHDLIDAIKNVRLLPKRGGKKDASKIIFEENTHPEDLHFIIRSIWNRMLEVDTETFPMDSIGSESEEDVLDIFVSSLYLSFYGRILLSQEVPYGTIWVTIINKSNAISPLPELKTDEPFEIGL